jgi:hypothetical protein
LIFITAQTRRKTSDPEQVVLDEIRQLYEGEVVTGHDLDVF